MSKIKKFGDLIYVFPACIFVSTILLVRLHLFSMPMTNIYWSDATDESTLSDLFNYWKSMAIIGAACLAVIAFVAAYFKDSVRLKKSFLYIPALIYVAFVLLSFAFSDYKYFALRGMSEHFEGTIVLLAYILMVFFLANAVDSVGRLKVVIYYALSVVLLLGILGVTQATGHDFFSTAFGQKLMTPNYMLDTGIKSWDMIDILASSGQNAYDFSFTEGEVYQTVYNINYVPMYLSLMVPLIAFVFIFFANCDDKARRIASVLSVFLYGLILYNYFSANSASGYFGLLVSFISVLVVAHKYIKTWLKPVLCLLLVACLIIGGLSDRWLPELKTLLDISSNNWIRYIYADDASVDNVQMDYNNPPASTWITIDYIETDESHVYFGINNSVIIIERDEEHSSFNLSDEQGQPLYIAPIENQNGAFQILDNRFHDYVKLSLSKDADSVFVIVSTVFNDWAFRYDTNGFMYRNAVGKYVKLFNIQHAKLDYHSGTGRGRIWATTIPLLPRFTFNGAGADCFTFVFPQNDYSTLYNMYSRGGALNVVTDKAHNLYMQYWVNTGLISLLAWLTMVGYYLVGAVKQFRKRGFVDFCDFVNGGIFCGICGFLAVAFFNDGSVNTMPMFYTMLGTGLAINMRDKWPSDETSTGSAAGDGPSTGSGPVEGKKGKKAKAAAEVMPEM